LAAPLASYAYFYDHAGNRTQANETVNGTSTVTIIPPVSGVPMTGISTASMCCANIESAFLPVSGIQKMYSLITVTNVRQSQIE
jgi:hypothetical protein